MLANIVNISLFPKVFQAFVFAVGLVFLSACADGINLSFGQQDEDDEDTDPVLIEIDESDIRPELDLDVSGMDLLLPGATRPLGTAPDVREIEKQLFASMAAEGTTATTYSVTFSQVELDVLNRTGARAANDRIRAALTPAPGITPTSQPIIYSAEIDMLSRAGVRTSQR